MVSIDKAYKKLSKIKNQNKFKKRKDGRYSSSFTYKVDNKYKNIHLGCFETEGEAVSIFEKFYILKFLYGQERALAEFEKYKEEENKKRFRNINCRYKEIKDAPGYFITEEGDLYSLNSTKNIGFLEKKCKTGTNTSGYIIYSIFINKKRIGRSAHRLVAEYFLYNFNENLMVDHIDRNKTNNKIENLRMVTNRENQINSDKFENAKGYTYKKGKYEAQIKCFGKNYSIGTFNTEEEAASAYSVEKKRTLNMSKEEFNKYYENIKKIKKEKIKGYYKVKNKEKYRAYVNFDGRRVFAGYHDTPEEAKSAYLKLKSKLSSNA